MLRPSKGNCRSRPAPGLFVCLLGAAYLLFAASLMAQAPEQKGSPDALRQLSQSVETLVRKVSPSVVQIVVTGYGPLEESSHSETGLVIGRRRAIGSGVIVDPDGYIMTNAHVVSGAQRAQVVVPFAPVDTSPMRSLGAASGRVVEARVVGVARDIDLALMKVEARDLPVLRFAKYSELRQGEMVFAFGSPEGLRNSVTMGVVSAVARQLDPDSPMVYIQTDAPINPGNSGGPLVNVDGELIGLNTFILTASGGNEGLGFAIPSGIVAVAYRQLRRFGHLHRHEIGASVQTITPTIAEGLKLPRNLGAIVSDVVPGGPADRAGLKIQDILLTIDGRPVDSLPVLAFNLFMHQAGEQVKVEVWRESGKVELELTVVEQQHEVDRLLNLANPEQNLIRKLGILGIEIDERIARMLPDLRVPSGVIVVARTMESGEADNSLATGDVIHAMNGAPVTSLQGLRSVLDALKLDSAVVLQIERDGKLRYLAFQMQ